MEMFNKQELKKRIGPLKKNDSLYDLEQVEGYVIRKCGENGLEHSYDVMAEEMPYFKTLAYTEYAGSFYLQPLNFKMRNEQMLDAWHDKKTKVLDYSSWLVKKVVENNANKYKERQEELDRFPPKDYLIILPGSNKLRENVCLNRLKHIVNTHGNNVLFKPHPITTHQIIGELKDFFGEENILPKNVDMYYYMQKAKGVYSTHISESPLFAGVLGKRIEPVDIWNNIQQGSFYCINSFLYHHQDNIVEYVNKTFSSYKSGIINPAIDENWKEKVDKYIEYICAKRDKYKNWYISSPAKKK
jgi:hypothetical protein|tara:strand:- start:4638 stop:5537 length:900 start_codon:yes stop_codon:yes gene_type:complete